MLMCRDVLRPSWPAFLLTRSTDGAEALYPPPLAVNDAVSVPPQAVPPKSYDSRAQLRRQTCPLLPPPLGVTQTKEAQHD